MSETREVKKGDWFVAVKLVDLAVALFTLGVPSYNPARPYTHTLVGKKKQISFTFDMQSNIAGVGATVDLMKAWHKAEAYEEPLSPVAVCKRVIWGRRNLLADLNAQEATFPRIGSHEGYSIATTVKHAAIAYALGFEKPDQFIFTSPGEERPVMLVGSKAPKWLGISTAEELFARIDEGIAYINKEGNELEPIAVASAAFINVVSWLDHLRQDKPHMRFTTSTGQTYWVREGTQKWKDLLALGYLPE